MKLSEIVPSPHRPGPKPTRPARPASTRLLVNLRKIREKHGLSLRDVTRSTDLDTASLLRAEQGATPSLENALRIASVYDFPVEQIWALKKQQKPPEA